MRSFFLVVTKTFLITTVLFSCSKEDSDFIFEFTLHNNEKCGVDYYITEKDAPSDLYLSNGSLPGNEKVTIKRLKTHQEYTVKLVKSGLSQSDFFYIFDIYSSGETINKQTY